MIRENEFSFVPTQHLYDNLHVLQLEVPALIV